jgi:hypothetical protein
MLDACASYAMDSYYPTAPSGTTGTFGIISPEDRRRTRYAEGMTAIPGGTLLLTIFRDCTIGEIETQAAAVESELASLSVGLPGIATTSGRCSEGGPSLTAGGETRKAIEITIAYGLNT